MKHNTLRTAASLTACLLSAVIVICGCQKDKLDPAKAASAAVTEGDFELTVAVSYGPSTNTKTTITQSSTILPVKWKTGDKLYVVGAKDGYLGSLTQTGDLSGDPVGRTAYFKGNVKGWSEAQVLHIYYLGDAPTIDTDTNTFSFDISSQDGTLAWIASNGHIAHGATASAVPMGTHTIPDLTLKNLNAVILYDLSAWTSGVEISGTYNKATLNLKTGAFKSDGYTTGDIALASDKCKATTYVTFIPDNKALTFKKGTANTRTRANKVEAGTFYSDNGSAIKIQKCPHYIEEGYDYGEGVMINSTIWAPENCGIGYDHSYPYGKMYQWGRKYGQGYNDDVYQDITYPTSGSTPQTLINGKTSLADGNSTEKSLMFYWKNEEPFSWTTESPDESDNWFSLYNPCPEGWRVPSMEELDKLIGGDGSGSGQPDMPATLYTKDGKKGAWFDGTKTPVENKGIFLPAGGYRQCDNGVASTRDTDGNYWCTKTYYTAAYHLFFNGGEAKMQSDGRANGNSIRCVYAGE